MNWAESIKILRNKMLLTQTEFAEKLGVSYVSVNRWENGEHEPTMKVKRKIKHLCLINDIDFNVNSKETKNAKE